MNLSMLSHTMKNASMGLVSTFLARFIHRLKNAVDYPSMWPEIEEEVRRYLVHRFPYGVNYSVEPYGYSFLP